MCENHENFPVAYAIDTNTSDNQINGNTNGCWHFGDTNTQPTIRNLNDDYGAVGNEYIDTKSKECVSTEGTMAIWNETLLAPATTIGVQQQQEREHSHPHQQWQQHSAVECGGNAMPNCAVCKRPVRNAFTSNGSNKSNNGHFGAEHICSGCAAFFKHCIAKRRLIIHCNRHSQCRQAEELMRCASCRLDRCLLAGMGLDANANVPGQQHFMQSTQQWIERRRALLMRTELMKNTNAAKQYADFHLNNKSVIKPSNQDQDHQQRSGEIALRRVEPQTNMQDWQKLNFLCMCEQRQKANWDAWTEIPAWIFKIKSMEQLLHCSSNFLTKYHESIDCHHLKSEEEFIDPSWNVTSVATNAICIDVLLLLEWATQMPVFARLVTADQLIFLKHIHKPFTAMINAFYSKLVNADIWTRANGHKFFRPEMYGPLWEDERLRFLGKQFFCAGLEALGKMDIGREEFALLLSIICCNSNADGLSAAGRELLYNQSADYSRVLIKFLQQQNGPVSGVKRFADCMHLLELMFCMRHRYEQFVVYRDLCKTMKGLACANQIKFPKALSMFSPYYNCQN